MTPQIANFQPDLIIDVGMHNGDDSEFYLRKGFRVVAIEANPVLVEKAKQRFQQHILTGRLTVIGKAIAAHPGPVELWVNDDNDEWSSLSQEYVDRNDRIGTGKTLTSVQSIQFNEVLQAHGVPYYLKIDIEGMDHLCVKALHSFSSRPKYISVETSGTNDFEYTFELLASLYLLGYRKFKLINQYLNQSIRLPNPPREGVYVDHRFEGTAVSGPFGEETPGAWEPIEPIIRKYGKVLRLQAKYTIQAEKFHPILSFLYYKLHHLFGLEPVGWYDIHAKYDTP